MLSRIVTTHERFSDELVSSTRSTQFRSGNKISRCIVSVPRVRKSSSLDRPNVEMPVPSPSNNNSSSSSEPPAAEALPHFCAPIRRRGRRRTSSPGFRQSLALLPAVVMAFAFLVRPSFAGWNPHSSLLNSTAVYVHSRNEFQVYLLPGEILDYIVLPGYACTVPADQSYVQWKQVSSVSTLLQWNPQAGPEPDLCEMSLNCTKLDVKVVVRSTPDIAENVRPLEQQERRRRDAPHEASSAPSLDSSSSGAASAALDDAQTTSLASSTAVDDDKSQITAPTTTTVASESPSSLSSSSSSPSSSVDATPTPVPSDTSEVPNNSSVASESTARDSAPPETSTTSTSAAAAPNPTSADSPQTALASFSTTESTETRTDGLSSSSTTVQHVQETSQTNSDRTTSTTTTTTAITAMATLDATTAPPMNSTEDEVPTPTPGFTLTIRRLNLDYVHGLVVPSLEAVFNITKSLNARVSHRVQIDHSESEAFRSTLGSALGEEQVRNSTCTILPKEVLAVNRDYVILAVAVDSVGQAVRAGHMNSLCDTEGWLEAASLLPEAERAGRLTSQNFQLKMLIVGLAAVIVVLALVAVFLCTKWRLAVRGSRRDASDGFYVKTFHTKEHHYKPDDDDPYGFPTIPRNRDTSNAAGGRSSGRPGGGPCHDITLGRSSFVNGGFHDEAGDGSLPPPPPELRACLIDDSQFTEVPLHNLGSDSLGRAHRGVGRSPPAPPLRTVSSGYATTSGQSSPTSPSTSPPAAVVSPEYHRPHEVLVMMPPIPKEDYSDDSADDEPSRASRSHYRPPPVQPPLVDPTVLSSSAAAAAEHRKGRFTVRTAL